jgi:sigma-B regulation protein RsbU (phosphoserine phosphatase)
MKNSGLATRLTIFILASTAFIFVAVLTYNYYSAKATIMSDAVDDAKNLTLATGNKIEVILNGVEKIPRVVAGILEEQPPNRDALLRLLKRALANNPEIFGIAVAFEPFAFDPKQNYFAPYVHRDRAR